MSDPPLPPHTQATVERVIARLLRDVPAESGAAGTRPPLDELLRRHVPHVPGVSVAVSDGGRLAWALGLGVLQAGAPGAVTTRTLFQAGSISKPITALAVMRLVERGVLDLDEDVNAYLTSWRVPPNGTWQPRVTLRQLLSHSAGTTVRGFLGYLPDSPLPSLPQILNGEGPATNRRVEVDLVPGLTYRYSGGGTTVVQQVITDVLRRPFEEAMRELVLLPCGMTDSTFAQPLAGEWAARAASGHQYPGWPLACRYLVFPQQAAAGLWTTPSDLVRACLALLRSLSGEPGGILSPATAAALLAPQLQEGRAREEGYMGLGFYFRGEGRGLLLEHKGRNEGFVSLLRLHVHTGQGAVVMTNANEGGGLIEELMRALASEYAWPGAVPSRAAPGALLHPLAYAGTYSAGEGVIFTIREAGGTLCLVFDGQPPIPLQPVSETEFFATPVEASLRFEKDDQNRISGLVLIQAHSEFRALRRPDPSA